MQNQFLEAAKILKPQGINGEVKADVLLDNVSDILGFDTLFMKTENGFSPVKIAKSRVQGEFAYLQITGITDRNSAEKLRNAVLYFDRNTAKPLPENRFYIADVIGCNLETFEGETIGVITDVLKPGANDVFVVKNHKAKMFVPVISKLIIKWSIPENKIIINKKILSEVCLLDN